MRFTESMAADCMLTPPSLLVADFDRAKKPADLFNRTSLPCLHTKTTKQYNHKTKWANISHRIPEGNHIMNLRHNFNSSKTLFRIFVHMIAYNWKAAIIICVRSRNWEAA